MSRHPSRASICSPAIQTGASVLVDEAHNFRNPGTRRYAALSSYLWDSDRKVVLLSATPQNLGPADIYHQLRLFLDDLDHGLPLEPQSLQEYFTAIQSWYQYELDVANWQQERLRLAGTRSSRRTRQSPVPPPPAARPADASRTPSIEQVLGSVFLRRRRKDIRELYGDDVEVGGQHGPLPGAGPGQPHLPARQGLRSGRAAGRDRQSPGSASWRPLPCLGVPYCRPRAATRSTAISLRARNRVARADALPAVQAAGVQCRGVPLHARRADPEQPELPRGARSGHRADRPDRHRPCWPAKTWTSRRCWNASRPRRIGATQSACHGRGWCIRPRDFDVARWLRDLDADHAVLDALAADVARVDTETRTTSCWLCATSSPRPDVAAGKVLIFSEAAATVDYLYAAAQPRRRRSRRSSG